MSTNGVNALVIFGATGDLAKLETFPALVGLVGRGVLDAPIVGVAKSGWGLDQFRNYAAESLRNNDIDPDSDAAKRMLGLLRYVDGDLNDDATYQAMAAAAPAGPTLFYLEVPPPLFGMIAGGITGPAGPTMPGSWSRSRSAPTSRVPSSSTTRCTSTSPRTRSTGSTTGWAWRR